MEDFPISTYLADMDGNKKKGTCRKCAKVVGWAREKVAGHYRVCPLATSEEKQFFKNYKRTKSTKGEKGESSGSGSDMDISQGSINSEVLENLSEERRRDIDEKLAHFFYATGISFRVAESQAFKNLITALNPLYAKEIPSRWVLSNRLLSEEYEKVKTPMNELINSSSNLVLVSDGWTNVNKEHLVNFCIKCPNQKTFFYSSIDTSGIQQTGENVAAQILRVIEEIGAEKFSGVITDNAPVMAAAWKIIEAKYRHISANGCAAHCVNLLIGDMISVTKSEGTINEGMAIVKFITNHHMINSRFETARKAAHIPHKLSLPVVTRWFSTFNFAHNLLACKFVLMEFLDNNPDLFNQHRASCDAVMKSIKLTAFWDRLAKLVKMIEVPKKVIRK
jgi:hypothetical protein